MAIERSGGGGRSAAYLPLLDFLKEKLGGYFFQREGMPTEDVASINLIRLRALFENTGQKSSLLTATDRSEGDLKLTVHEAATRTKSPKITQAVNALFGQPGHININLGGNTMPDGVEARAAVAGQWTDMRRIGTPDEVVRQSPVQASQTGVSAPGPSNIQVPGEDDVRRSGDFPTTNPGARPDSEVGPIGSGAPSGPGGGGEGWPGNTDPSLNPDGTPRQIPGGAELWHVDGKVYLAYKSPTGAAWMIWHVENPDRLNAIYGGSVPALDKEMTQGELDKISPWYGGLSAELQNTSEDPWTQFMADFKEAAKLRPWLNDPTVQAVMQGAYLEGRAPTQDELSQTDWWDDHTAAERAWLEQSVTMGRDEIARQRDDMARQVADALRQAGINNAPDELVKHIAEQSLTGKWSEQYTQDQIRKLADPMAPGKLDRSVKELLDGTDLDSTKTFENEVRGLMEEWLGPDLGRFNDKDVERWAGRLRNDPDGAVELEEALRQQRQVILPKYNENLTYRQIITPVENLATNIWGQPVQDSAFLVDLANTMDYSEMSTRLRRRGRKQGVQKVLQDMFGAAGSTPVGERVVRSEI